MASTDDQLDRSKKRALDQAKLEREADAERLLAGEDPSTPYAEDAKHWADVYAELIGFKRDLLARLSEDRRVLSDAAMTELERDENLLRVELDRLKLRLSFWETRRKELSAE